MAQKEFSEKKMQNVVSQANEWFAEFKESHLFKELTPSAQTNGETVTTAFSVLMYKEELRAGREWTAGTLENILSNVFPEAITTYSEVSHDVNLILTHYFTFLKETKKISNADTLIRKIEKLPNATELVSEKKQTSSVANQVKGAQKANSYSELDINRFNRFAMGNDINQVIAKPQESKPQIETVIKSVGRNASCPCGSGKKYKKCHGK